MFRIATIFLIVLAVLVAATTVASARTWYIKPDGTGDAPTIQAGIDLAAVGDMVLLGLGTYTGVGNKDLDFGGKDLVLRSEAGPKVTIIDCEGAGRGLYFHGGESAAAVVDGLTITEGDVLYPAYGWNGGGICCLNSSPTVSNCIFLRNCADRGGGIYAEGCAITITDCSFLGNVVAYGGGVYFSGGTAIVANCIFLENGAGDGGGISIEGGASVTITHCTLSGNSSASWGAAVCGWPANVENTVISFNLYGEPVHCWLGVHTLKCCDLYGNAGGDWVGCIADQYGVNGNFSADPLFCLRWPGDYCIDYSSPCAPGNHPYGYDCGLIGAGGVGCDRPTGIQPTTWGSIKGMFR